MFQKLYTSKKLTEFQKGNRDLTYTNATKIQDNGKECLYDIAVRRLKDGRTKRVSFRVTMDKESLDIRCECKNFEFKGIMCSHSLCVFHEEELQFVPDRYILDRWRKDLPRKHLKIPVPYYSLLKKKPKAMERNETMQHSFESIFSLTMTNENMYHEVMDALSGFSLKANLMMGEHGLMSQSLNNIGKVYGRRLVHNDDERNVELETVGMNNDPNQVKDPLDRRGRGRPPAKRKGYHNDKPTTRRRSKHLDILGDLILPVAT